MAKLSEHEIEQLAEELDRRLIHELPDDIASADALAVLLLLSKRLTDTVEEGPDNFDVARGLEGA